MFKKILIFICSALILSLLFSVNVMAEDPDLTAIDKDSGPSEVENITIDTSDGSVTISWDAATDNVAVTGYGIGYGTENITADNPSFENDLDVGDVTEYTFDDLEPTDTYYFAVYAYDDAGLESESWSNVVSTTEDVENPSDVDNLYWKYNSEGSVKLFWDAATDNFAVTGYVIDYGTTEVTADNPSFENAIDAGNVTEYVVDNLETDKIYYFAVYAYDAAGNESIFWSDVISFDYSNEKEDFIAANQEVACMVFNADDLSDDLEEETKNIFASYNFDVENEAGMEGMEEIASKYAADAEVEDAIMAALEECADDLMNAFYAPYITEIELLNDTTFIVQFSETVVLGDTQIENFLITAGNDTSDVLNITSIQLVPGNVGKDDSAAVVQTEDQENITYVLTLVDVADEDGNVSIDESMAFEGIHTENYCESVEIPKLSFTAKTNYTYVEWDDLNTWTGCNFYYKIHVNKVTDDGEHFHSQSVIKPVSNHTFYNLDYTKNWKFYLHLYKKSDYGYWYEGMVMDDVGKEIKFNYKSSGSSKSKKSLPKEEFWGNVMSDFDNYLSPFPDIDLDSLEGKAAAELSRREVISGFPDGYFKGEEFVNRAQLAKFLILTKWGEMGEVTDNGYFPDLVPGSWYISYVTTANALGIITGHPSGEFKPADYVQVSEFAKMFSKTFDLETYLPYSFLDVDIDAWYSKYIGIISYYDLMPYRGDYLYPSAYMTRAEVAVAIYQYLSNRSYSQSWVDSWEDENEDTENPSDEDTENPSDVENVLLTEDDQSITISWNATTDNVAVTGYGIGYGTEIITFDNPSFENMVDAGNVIEYTFDNLETTETYYFAVYAYDADDNESVGWSNVVSNTENWLPVAQFSVNKTNVLVGETIYLTSYSYDEDSSIVEYIWDLEGDGFENNEPTSKSIIEFTPDEANIDGIDIKLKVIDDKGGESESEAIKIYVTEDVDDVLLMQTEPQTGDTIAFIKTNMGEIKVFLYTDLVPETATNFIEHAEAGKYDGVIFHRVIDDFMIQTGDFENMNGTGGYSYKGPGTSLDDEFGEGLTHLKGALSMANAGPNTGGSQFFIVQNEDGTDFLDGAYAIFGFVYEGLDVVDDIAAVETTYPDKPVEDVVIESIEISTY